MRRFAIGQIATTQRTFSRQDLAEYADLTGTTESADPRSVPHPLIGGMFSYLLGTQLPGRGTNYLKQHLEFPNPAFQGEELTARVEIIRLRPEKKLVNLRSECTNARGEIVCQGEALVLAEEV